MTSTKGKLEVLQSHYQKLGSCSLDAVLDDSWKREVDKKVLFWYLQGIQQRVNGNGRIMTFAQSQSTLTYG